MKKYSLGIDIGGTTVKLGLFTVEGELLKKWEIETRKVENGRYILGDITESINDVLEKENINKGLVLSRELVFQVLLQMMDGYKDVLTLDGLFSM